jgi:hypothetical protein
VRRQHDLSGEFAAARVGADRDREDLAGIGEHVAARDERLDRQHQRQQHDAQAAIAEQGAHEVHRRGP